MRNPVEIARRWNAAGESIAPSTREQSPTIALLQDKAMSMHMTLLRKLAKCTATILAAELLFYRLQADGVQGEIVSNLDENACTVCLGLKADCFKQITSAIESYGYTWRLVDIHHGAEFNIVTITAMVEDKPVFVSVNYPVDMSSAVREAA